MSQPAFDLKGRVAFVTGGNGGIGLGMAAGLADAGAAVAISGRDAGKLEAAAADLKARGADVMTLAGDVSDRDRVFAMADEIAGRFGRLDILVANAGINLRKRPEEYEAHEWQSVLDTNLNGPFFCAQAVYPHMKKAGGGKIITIGSMASIFGIPKLSPYSASKGGIVQVTRVLASAWAEDNIQANCILPGWIDTALTRKARHDIEGLHDRVVARTPAGRWGDPKDFAGIAVFLASPASDFVTGTAIPVDGGYTVQAG
ncbi:MAG: glucose 1-dehydrogenase [Pseudomonadota bacterium]